MLDDEIRQFYDEGDRQDNLPDQGVIHMAENQNKNKCAHPACDCPREEGSKYCGEYCENAEKLVSWR